MNGKLSIIYREKNLQLYIQVYRIIYLLIINEELKENDKLPTEHEISKLLSVSRETVRMALVILQEDRMVKTIHGKGTFVTYNKKRLKQNNKLKGINFKKYVEDFGLSYTVSDVNYQNCKEDAFLEQKFNLQENEHIARLNRVHSANETIFAVTDEFFVQERLVTDGEMDNLSPEKWEEFVLEKISLAENINRELTVTSAKLDRAKQLGLSTSQDIILIKSDIICNDEIVIYSKCYFNTQELECRL